MGKGEISGKRMPKLLAQANHGLRYPLTESLDNVDYTGVKNL